MKYEFFFDIFSKNPQVSNSMKMHIVGAELLIADRQTDRHEEANSSSSKLCETNIYIYIFYLMSFRPCITV